MNQPVSTLRSELQQAPALFENFLARFFQENSERYAYGELFEPLYLDMTEFVARRGKRIRPMLLIGSYRIFGGDRPLEDASLLRSALSLELLHSFILIHDDVIDQSERRRRLPTFHKLVEERLGKIDEAARTGGNVAIVVGDILFAMAVDTLRSTDFAPALRDAALSHFLHYVSDTGVGEIYDILLGTRDIARVGETDITRMYTLKTTRYTFEAPLVLGALLAGAGDDLLRELAELIEPVGLAFQIQNDLIEYHQFKGVDRLRQTDLLEGKKTLLLRVAYDHLDDPDRSFLQLCLSTRTSNDASVSKIEQLIDKSGAVALLTRRMENLFQKAEAALDNSSFTPRQREGLGLAFDPPHAGSCFPFRIPRGMPAHDPASCPDFLFRVPCAARPETKRCLCRLRLLPVCR
jgi:geranylgeranyl diphosphate synthase type I